MKNNNFYVYVYIDPRNYEEFYYGKGQGSRKYAHLKDDTISAKTTRIKEIEKAGLEPIIKVVASNLSKDEALLVETAFIWKLGKNLTNKVEGLFSKKFRPQNTIHLNLPNFDFQNGFYFFNVGESGDKHWDRDWEDNRKYGFISAGQGEQFSKQIKSLKRGDLIAAYLSKRGYVGIGEVKGEAVMIKDFKFNGKSLRSQVLNRYDIFRNSDDPKKSDWVVPVKWISTVSKKEAKWRKGLFKYLSIKASLANQKKTIDFLEKEFNFKVGD